MTIEFYQSNIKYEETKKKNFQQHKQLKNKKDTCDKKLNKKEKKKNIGIYLYTEYKRSNNFFMCGTENLDKVVSQGHPYLAVQQLFQILSVILFLSNL